MPRDDIRNTVRRICFDPGVIFPIANIFAFIQSDSLPAIACALGTAGVAVAVSYAGQAPESRLSRAARRLTHFVPSAVRDQFKNPLRVNAWGVLIPTAIVAAAAVTGRAPLHLALLPALAGALFSSGSFCATSERRQNAQHDPRANPLVKTLTNPAVHWGLAYAVLGLMAGGGLDLLVSLSSRIPAALMTALGILTTSLSTFGLMRGGFSNPASPYMILVHGTSINALIAAITGNIFGMINMIGAGFGEFLLGRSVHEEHRRRTPETSQTETRHTAPPAERSEPFPEAATALKPREQSHPQALSTFRKLEHAVNWPMRLFDRRQKLQTPKQN